MAAERRGYSRRLLPLSAGLSSRQRQNHKVFARFLLYRLVELAQSALFQSLAFGTPTELFEQPRRENSARPDLGIFFDIAYRKHYCSRRYLSYLVQLSSVGSKLSELTAVLSPFLGARLASNPGRAWAVKFFQH